MKIFNIICSNNNIDPYFYMKARILMVVSALFGLIMINGGLNKFFNYMPAPEGMPQLAMKLMGAFVESGYMFPLIALTEIVAGLMIILNKTRALGAIIIAPVTVNILLFHIFVAPEGMIVGIIIFLINCWIIFENKNKYYPILS